MPVDGRPIEAVVCTYMLFAPEPLRDDIEREKKKDFMGE